MPRRRPKGLFYDEPSSSDDESIREDDGMEEEEEVCWVTVNNAAACSSSTSADAKIDEDIIVVKEEEEDDDDGQCSTTHADQCSVQSPRMPLGFSTILKVDEEIHTDCKKKMERVTLSQYALNQLDALLARQGNNGLTVKPPQDIAALSMINVRNPSAIDRERYLALLERRSRK